VAFKRVAIECTATDPGDKVARESSRLVLRRAFRHLEREIPTSVTRVLRWLRHPRSRWVRIPAGILFILGGFLAILPVFGAWMIPVGLLLLAADIPFLRRPVGHGTIWVTERWRGAKGWYHRRRKNY
jgi:hypothetical protein